ncbi:hypothetical protein DPMN_147287 [Dreissena polymorpha]|uniref:Uncharacterized protein n=1 Tax=Dreissena polymorpha TaxID=45954 RepID=A0A9D4F8S1_DREPO|nr:hypothetical protein DPMN_147287 [Dreissena polymorpha]
MLDLKAIAIDIYACIWEAHTQDRCKWIRAVHLGLERVRQLANNKRTRREGRQLLPAVKSAFICVWCGSDCHLQVDVHSHCKRCKSNPQEQAAWRYINNRDIFKRRMSILSRD